jgi:hypothetical protein
VVDGCFVPFLTAGIGSAFIRVDAAFSSPRNLATANDITVFELELPDLIGEAFDAPALIP